MQRICEKNMKRLCDIAAKLSALGGLLRNWDGQGLTPTPEVLDAPYGLGLLISEQAAGVGDVCQELQASGMGDKLEVELPF